MDCQAALLQTQDVRAEETTSLHQVAAKSEKIIIVSSGKILHHNVYAQVLFINRHVPITSAINRYVRLADCTTHMVLTEICHKQTLLLKFRLIIQMHKSLESETVCI